MPFIPVNQVIGAQPIAETSTTQKHPLGTKTGAVDTTYGYGEFVYALGVASTVVGDWVFINTDDGTTARAAAAGGQGVLGVAMSANVASQYGWYQVYGKAIGNVLAGFADDAQVYLTATAGSVDDADVSGDLIIGAKGASAISSGQAEFELSYPVVAGVAD